MILEMRDICKDYPMGKSVAHILKNVNLDVEEGEYLAIMGPSGSGKTTLMNLIGCLDVPTSGSYLLGGRDVTTCNNKQLAEVRNKELGFVFQSFNLLPKLTALENVALPLLWNLGAVALGLALAVLLRWLAGQGHSQAHTLVLVNAVLLFLSGLCSTLGISPLLACMALGAGYVNLGGEKRLFKRMDKFSPPFLLLFFALSGLRLNIPSLATAGVIGVAYFFVRIAGKYAGASSGAALCRADPSIIKYLGLALTPQAGVSIGLAVLGQRMLPAAEGTMLATIILSSAVLYELTGPACAKLALLRSGAIPRPATRQPARGHGRMPSMPDTGDTQEPPRAAG